LPDDLPQPLADAAAVRDLGHGDRAVAAQAQPGRLRAAAQLAAAAAAGLRDAAGGAGPGLVRGGRQRGLAGRLRRLPVALPAAPTLAGRRLDRRRLRRDLEPSVVPGLSLALHPRPAARGPVAALGARQARVRLAAGAPWRLAGAGPGAVLPRAAAVAGAALSADPRGHRRLGPARRGHRRLPARLPGRARRRARGGTGADAPQHPGDRTVRDLRGAAAESGRSAYAARRGARGAGAAAMARHRTSRARSLHVDGAAGDLRLGARAARPAVPLAALRHRGGVPLVHPAPEPDRADRVRADSAAARRRAGSRAGGGGDDRRLPAAARVRDPAQRGAAAAVRPAAPRGRGTSAFAVDHHQLDGVAAAVAVRLQAERDPHPVGGGFAGAAEVDRVEAAAVRGQLQLEVAFADHARAHDLELAIEQRFRVALSPGSAVAQQAGVAGIELVWLQLAVAQDL